MFADAAEIDGKTPYEQARVYEASGQLWMARLVLEQKGLGADATKDETELLARICHEQNDEPCVASCGEKLGRKLRFDGGAPRAHDAGREAPPEGATADLAKAEISTLQAICTRQGDRMCVALCETKLKGRERYARCSLRAPEVPQ